ncbi:SDR family oxidoreductase [Streptomyces sp. NPDC048111]|uniref:SDR family oxidoreductase n=1 Tax=Streptomyces sp. NPDC048111 TaxID=3365500 RepID=UPI0037115316
MTDENNRINEHGDRHDGTHVDQHASERTHEGRDEGRHMAEGRDMGDGKDDRRGMGEGGDLGEGRQDGKAGRGRDDGAGAGDARGSGTLVIAVVGGTGTVGRPVVEELAGRGHTVRVLSRRSATHPVDLSTGEGLEAALAGCDVVVDAANSVSPRTMRATLVDGTTRLIAAGRAAGVSHHVCVSIVGCDRVPMPYYKVKTAQEDAVTVGGVPWTIVRATQFHELFVGMFGAMARAGVVLAPRDLTFQPIAAAEAARAVADAAESAPRNGRIEVAGPERADLRTLARVWRDTTSRRVLLVPAPLPGPIGRTIRAGHLTSAHPDARGTTTFTQWLTERARGA